VADPLQSTLPPGRHGLPKEFVAANQRTRLLSGFSHSLRSRGYTKTTIANITACASISRRTFYEHFDGKEAIANCLLVKELAKSIPLNTGLGVYAIETLVRGEEEPADAERSIQVMEELLARVRDLDHPTAPQPLPSLRGGGPMGKERPRLAESFIAASQRDRLVVATAKVIVARRYLDVRVSDIVSEGGVARNTFYERFANKEEAARRMIRSISEELAEHLQGLSFEIGTGIVVVELIAPLIAEDREAMLRKVEGVVEVLGLLRSALEDQ
jgi:AcrR family transcriptional regulator